MSITSWPAEVANDLIEAIITDGELSNASLDFPLGRVMAWPAVVVAMQNKGYNFSKAALQAQWSRDARLRLAVVLEVMAIPAGQNTTTTLSSILEFLRYLPSQNVVPSQSEASDAISSPSVASSDASSQSRASSIAISYRAEIYQAKLDAFRSMTNEERADYLSDIRETLAALRKAMEEANGVDTVESELLDFLIRG